MKEILLSYTQYNYWANERICRSLAIVSDELFNKELKSSFPTIRKTVTHMWGAEFIWYSRVTGSSPAAWPGQDYKGSITGLCGEFLKASQNLAGFVSASDDAGLAASLKYRNMAGIECENTVFEMLFHCVNHSTFHRGQIITMLRETGFTNLPSTDYIVYLRELKQ